MTTHATTNSVAFSTSFGDPIFISSSKHSEKTDAFGIGVFLLMCLLGEPANRLLTKWRTRWPNTLRRKRTPPSAG